MTDRDLMQQALDALQAYGAHASNCEHLMLLTSLPPQRKPCSCGLVAAITALRERLAQPDQEPVAWGVFDGPNLHDMFFTEQDAHVMARLKSAKSVVKPLYTTAPQRKPLTVKEIKKLIHPIVMADLSDEMTDFEIVRAIEAAHGIKE